jgi:hypothetical protein
MAKSKKEPIESINLSFGSFLLKKTRETLNYFTCSFAQLSFNEVVRLKTSCSGVET